MASQREGVLNIRRAVKSLIQERRASVGHRLVAHLAEEVRLVAAAFNADQLLHCSCVAFRNQSAPAPSLPSNNGQINSQTKTDRNFVPFDPADLLIDRLYAR